MKSDRDLPFNGADKSFAFVVATKDRPVELRRLLGSLAVQIRPPESVVVVDGGRTTVQNLIQEFRHLPLQYLRCRPPSAARQRNAGIKAVGSHVSLIGFLDDDVVLEPDACRAVLEFWEKAPGNIGGTAFNQVNHPRLYASWLKHLPLAERLGLYSREGGRILPSGFQVMLGYVPETTWVQWLPTGASLWRREIFDEFQFDEWFEGYSYLEDLDFSYRVFKKYRLAVVADARYYHCPAKGGRGSGFTFGKREVIHRIYFVRKHAELSVWKCYLAFVLRVFISVSLAFQERKASYFSRILGNLVGFFQSITGRKSGLFMHRRPG
ncbi:MAG: glycosyltransferase [Candidatus Aminicenantales bacterium]